MVKVQVFKAQCSPGTYYNSAVKNCVICPKGSYQPNFGQYQCIVCAEGRTTIHEGNTDEKSCLCKPRN